MAKQRQIDQKMPANKCNKKEPMHDVDETQELHGSLATPDGLADPQDLLLFYGAFIKQPPSLAGTGPLV